jgi:type VI secretion system secreted protein Hcp
MKFFKRFFLVAALSLSCFLPATAFSAVDMFLKLDGIKGESTDSAHPEEIEIASFSWGASQTGAFLATGAGGAGRVSIQDFHFYKYIDKASPQLFLACLKRQFIPTATFSIRRSSDGTAQSFDYFVVTMTNVMVTGMNQNGASVNGDGSLLDTLALNFTKIEWTYTPTNPDGSAGTPVHGGWDLKTSKGL